MISTKLLVGHVLDRLSELPSDSVHCCVTSPPYWGLRDYGTEPQVWDGDENCEHQWGEEGRSGQRNRNELDNLNGCSPLFLHPLTGAFCPCGAWRGQLGLEPSPALYIKHLVQVFGEIRRVLRHDGTFWLNIGDSYARDAKKGQHKPGDSGKQAYVYDQGGGRASAGLDLKQETQGSSDGKVGRGDRAAIRNNDPSLKPKDLVGIPWMLAFALRDSGWYLRSEIIWSKTAPMPESVTDRPTKSHEQIFLFSKSQSYFYDQEAVKEQAISPPAVRDRASEPYNAALGDLGTRYSPGAREYGVDGKRNLRDVWTLGPAGFTGAHFATFPPEIPRRAISAGTSEKGVCAKCGAPWERVVKVLSKSGTKQAGIGVDSFEGVKGRAGEVINKTIGWQPICTCNAEIIPATVLDPFFGSGTTGVVAQQLWRSCIGIDLSDKYAQIGKDRMPDGLLHSLDVEPRDAR